MYIQTDINILKDDYADIAEIVYDIQTYLPSQKKGTTNAFAVKEKARNSNKIDKMVVINVEVAIVGKKGPFINNTGIFPV